MRISWSAALRAAAMGLALVWGVPGAGAQAPAGGAACRGALAGTYLATIRTEPGAFASRALVTLNGDGTLTVADSGQYQGVQGASFSTQHGSYRCTGPRSAQATVLSFGFPPQQTIVRSDWSIGHDPAAATPSGSITLFIFPGVEGVDPFGAGGRRIGPFRFTSVRVAPGSGVQVAPATR